MKNLITFLIVTFSCLATAAQQTIQPIPIISIDDFSNLSSKDYTDYAKLKQSGYTPTCISNGLIGISPGPNPLIGSMNNLNKASTTVNGYVHNQEIREYEQMAAAPYPLGIDLGINGNWLRNDLDHVRSLKQTLDMNNGELTTAMNYSPTNEINIKIDIVQFASRFIPSVLCEKLTFTSNKDIVLDLTTHIDTTNSDGEEYGEQKRQLTETTKEDVPNIVDQIKVFKSDNESKLGIGLLLQRDRNLSFKKIGKYSIYLKANKSYDVKLMASMVSDLYHPDPHLECIRLVRWAEMVGYDNLLLENRKIWKELWKSRIRVTGATEFEQKALDVAFYYLQSNIHSSSKLGYPPFGMTQSWAYYGHNFWDMDMWTLIPTLLVQPNAAKAMVNYRYDGLEPAKNKAALFGFRGAQYPWEASRVGWEVTPTSAETGWAEQHTIGPAVAGWEYYLATGDKIFLKEKVWPIMREVATWLESRGELTKRGYEYKYIMGHDENISNVNNSSYFNLLAKRVMGYTIDCASELAIQCPNIWKKMASSIFIPMNENGKVVYPFDMSLKVRVYDEEKMEYFDQMPSLEGKGYSLGNLNALFVHDVPLTDAVIRSTYYAEEKIRQTRSASPSVPGSIRSPSFALPPLMSLAAFCGDTKRAHQLFTDLWKGYWLAPFGMLKEYQSQSYGSYITGFGSLLQNVMLGYTGLRISKDNWVKYKSSMPTGWTKIEIDQIWIKGKSYKLSVINKQKAKLTINNN